MLYMDSIIIILFSFKAIITHHVIQFIILLLGTPSVPPKVTQLTQNSVPLEATQLNHFLTKHSLFLPILLYNHYKIFTHHKIQILTPN